MANIKIRESYPIRPEEGWFYGCLIRCNGKGDGEFCPLSFLGFNNNLAAMVLDKPIADRKPEANPLNAFCFGGKKRVKNFVYMLGLYAGSCIPDGDMQF